MSTVWWIVLGYGIAAVAFGGWTLADMRSHMHGFERFWPDLISAAVNGLFWPVWTVVFFVAYVLRRRQRRVGGTDDPAS